MLKNLLKVVVILTVLVAVFRLVKYFIDQKNDSDDFDDEFNEDYILPTEDN